MFKLATVLTPTSADKPTTAFTPKPSVSPRDIGVRPQEGAELFGTAVSAVGIVGGALKTRELLGRLAIKNLNKMHNPVTAKDINKLRTLMDVKAVPIVKNPMFAGGPHFAPPYVVKMRANAAPSFGMFGRKPRVTPTQKREGYIYLGDGKMRDIDVAAHEMGHATGRHKWYNRKGIALPTRLLAAGGPLAGMIAGGISSNPDDSVGTTLGRGAVHGGSAGLASGFAVLGEEARANYHALKAMKRMGYSTKRMIRASGKLGLAYSTYLMTVGLGPAAIGAGSALYARKIKQIQARQQAEADKINAKGAEA